MSGEAEELTFFQIHGRPNKEHWDRPIYNYLKNKKGLLTRPFYEFVNWSGRKDLNLRPHAPQACALPGCATPRLERGNKKTILNGKVYQIFFEMSLTGIRSLNASIFQFVIQGAGL